MLIVMRQDATPEQIEAVVRTVHALGLEARTIDGRRRTTIGIVSNEGAVDPAPFAELPGVRETLPITRPYKQVSREWQEEPTVVELPGGSRIGDGSVTLIAGPCAVESREQILEAAHGVREAGATALRGGAFKPRTSPYSFQGLGEVGLRFLAEAGEAAGLPIVTEVLEPGSVDVVAEYADVLQVGARNMQNYPLLRRAGRMEKPVLLKRGMSATITELLLAAEYILAEGNPRVILCERGVRSFDSAARNLLDLTAVPIVKDRSHLPILVDPSHGTGSRALVPRMALAAVAAGADGLLVEVHPDPASALSDGAQSLRPEQFAELVHDVAALAAALGRPIAAPAHASVRAV